MAGFDAFELLDLHVVKEGAAFGEFVVEESKGNRDSRSCGGARRRRSGR